jgi:hypothetical protein
LLVTELLRFFYLITALLASYDLACRIFYGRESACKLLSFKVDLPIHTPWYYISAESMINTGRRGGENCRRDARVASLAITGAYRNTSNEALLCRRLVYLRDINGRLIEQNFVSPFVKIIIAANRLLSSYAGCWRFKPSCLPTQLSGWRSKAGYSNIRGKAPELLSVARRHFCIFDASERLPS